MQIFIAIFGSKIKNAWSTNKPSRWQAKIDQEDFEKAP